LGGRGWGGLGWGGRGFGSRSRAGRGEPGGGGGSLSTRRGGSSAPGGDGRSRARRRRRGRIGRSAPAATTASGLRAPALLEARPAALLDGSPPLEPAALPLGGLRRFAIPIGLASLCAGQLPLGVPGRPPLDLAQTALVSIRAAASEVPTLLCLASAQLGLPGGYGNLALVLALPCLIPTLLAAAPLLLLAALALLALAPALLAT
jgi:hypothetical protein